MPDEGIAGEIRPAQEVARRSLALFSVIGVAFGSPKNEVTDWLRTERLWDDLTPAELAYLKRRRPTRKMHIYFSWHSERLVVLLWALGLVKKLPDSATQCDTSVFQSVLPPFARTSTRAFIDKARLIGAKKLHKQAEVYLDEHWQARDGERPGRRRPRGIDIEIVQERHQAINWITGYEGLPWDDVTTDT